MSDTSQIVQQLGQRVRQLRRERGLSQEDFACLCGLDRTYISSLERGHRNVSLKNIAVIAMALQISLSELFENLEIHE